jgi:hypothetical protein
MDDLPETTIGCPYCGELIDVLVNPEDAGTEYVEDCQVCCRPISILVLHDSGGGFSLSVRSENETF